MIFRKDDQTYPLQPDPHGRHMFGGVPYHKGIIPNGSDVPVHRIFEIDLEDQALPFSSPNLALLPLYHPLKYGLGGSSMQYRVISDDEIEIIQISDAEPDDEDSSYVKAGKFPEIRFGLLFPFENPDDLEFGTPTLGGSLETDQNEPCMNPSCACFGSAEQCELLASIPPIPIEGHEDIWWEFEGAAVFFHFWYCRGCDTVITATRAT